MIEIEGDKLCRFAQDFEVGLWNAWIFEVLSLMTVVPGFLIDRKSIDRSMINIHLDFLRHFD